MSKTKMRSPWRDGQMGKGEFYAHYLAKYFNLFLNRFRFEGDIEPEEAMFVMRQFWSVGTVACFKQSETEGSEEYPRGKPVFTPYAVNEWNIYHYPVTVSLIALQGVKFIPLTPQRVNVDACIGFVQRNKEPVFRVVDYYARKLAAIETVIQQNLNAHKVPWLIATSPEGADKARALADMLLGDNPALFVEIEETDKAKTLISGAPYIIDKLNNYRLETENALREYLGLNNLGIGEKKEHLLNAEIASNDEVTSASGDAFLDCLVEFFDQVRETLGIDIRVSLNEPEPAEMPVDYVPEGGEEDDDA